ncbi:MAG: hypothetical protein ABSD64_10040 [Terriglobales bacterium]|jgi:hypothetical protein
MTGSPDTFDKIWADKSDEELFHALAHRDEYEKLAIEELEREIAKRNLDNRQIEDLELVASKEKDDDNAKAHIPLQWPFRILLLIAPFPLGFSGLFIGAYYGSRGYARRYREVWKWMAFGFIFWLTIFLLRVLHLL